MTNKQNNTEKDHENKQSEKPAYEVLIHNRHETVIRIDTREYQITGLRLTKLNNFSFTLKLTHNGHFCLLDVNLSRNKSRTDFIDEAREVLFISEDLITQDMYTLMTIIEGMQRETIAKIEEERDAHKKSFTMSDIEEAKTVEFLSTRDVLFDELFKDLDTLGYRGDHLGKKILYLAATSRKLVHPLSVLTIANSAAGKSFAQRTILSLLPEDEVFRNNRLTPNALSHFGKYELLGGVLAIDEIGSLHDDTKNQLRTMLSEGKFVLSYAQRDPRTGQIETISKEILGPFAFFSSTTKAYEIDDETKNRMLIIKIVESLQQTKYVFDAILAGETEGRAASDATKAKIRRKYQLIQKVLRPLKVKFPAALAKKIQFAHTKQVFKRMFRSYISLIQSVAFHRQYLKTVHTESDGVTQYVHVDKKDVIDANEIMKELVGGSFSDLSPVNRQMIEHILAYCKKKKEGTSLGLNDITWTRKDIRSFTGWEHKPIDRAVRALTEMEYVVHVYGGERGLFFYQLNIDKNDFDLFDIDLWTPGSGGKGKSTDDNEMSVAATQETKSTLQSGTSEDKDDPFFRDKPYMDDKEFLQSLNAE